MSAMAPSRMTVRDFEALPDNDRFELIDGELVERSDGALMAYVAGQIFSRLSSHVDSDEIAWVLTGGAGYTLRPGTIDQCRIPNASVVRKSRTKDGLLPDSYFDFAPDVAVIVLTPKDRYNATDAKIRDYLDAGTQIVWLAKPISRRIIVYRPDGTEISFGPDDEVTADPVLPGFRMKVGDVFPPQ
jgi:Uma2 family endonuclease